MKDNTPILNKILIGAGIFIVLVAIIIALMSR
jgi:CHASE3 domain sensor protein